MSVKYEEKLRRFGLKAAGTATENNHKPLAASKPLPLSARVSDPAGRVSSLFGVPRAVDEAV
jgi:hypothetical protein